MGRSILFSNILGMFVFDERFRLIDSLLFKNSEEFKDRERVKKRFVERFGALQEPDKADLPKILEIFKDKKYYDRFCDSNIMITKGLIKASVGEDQLIMQAINSVDEIDKVINLLVKRLREWYSFYNPEFSQKIKDNKKFCELIKTCQKAENSMGGNLKKDDLQQIYSLAENILRLYDLRQRHESYLCQLLKRYCPNIQTLAGTTLAAKLIEKAGSLKKLVMFPASTIQLLGAEKALFRHLRNKRYLSPKYGLLHEHPLVAKAKEKGKAARILADKISIAAKVDYFKGDFIGDKLLEDIEEALK